jgi:hypothetical protein
MRYEWVLYSLIFSGMRQFNASAAYQGMRTKMMPFGIRILFVHNIHVYPVQRKVFRINSNLLVCTQATEPSGARPSVWSQNSPG